MRHGPCILDNKPVLLATSYLPLSVVAKYAITQKDARTGHATPGSPNSATRPVPFREEIRSRRLPSPDEMTQLSMTPGTPVILICRTAFTDQGPTPVEVNEMTLDAASYVLEYDFDANPKPTFPAAAAPADPPDSNFIYWLKQLAPLPARTAPATCAPNGAVSEI
ncbi:UTRA domain-containing protein [Tsukamurella paurometabola]